jgi:hypothetical protein
MYLSHSIRGPVAAQCEWLFGEGLNDHIEHGLGPLGIAITTDGHNDTILGAMNRWRVRGRRSGILTPRFGFAELVRNSPTYRRTIDAKDTTIVLSPGSNFLDFMNKK